MDHDTALCSAWNIPYRVSLHSDLNRIIAGHNGKLSVPAWFDGTIEQRPASEVNPDVALLYLVDAIQHDRTDKNHHTD